MIKKKVIAVIHSKCWTADIEIDKGHKHWLLTWRRDGRSFSFHTSVCLSVVCIGSDGLKATIFVVQTENFECGPSYVLLAMIDIFVFKIIFFIVSWFWSSRQAELIKNKYLYLIFDVPPQIRQNMALCIVFKSNLNSDTKHLVDTIR